MALSQENSKEALQSQPSPDASKQDDKHTDTSIPASTAADGSSIESEFDSSMAQMRESIKQSRELMVTYHLTQSKAEGLEALKKFALALDNSRQKHALLVTSALKKYQARPGQDAQLERFLYDVLSRNCEDDFYEGMLELGLALEKGGCKEAKLHYFISFAAMGNGQYDLARMHLEKFMSSGFDFSKLSEEARKTFIEDAQALERYIGSGPMLLDLWEAEKKLIAKDQAGEPLPRVRIVTNKGEIILELFENQAPETVGNFVKLVEEGFYNGLTFHRVLKHFMAQGGCPLGDGSGDPGYTIVGELGKPDARNFFRGTVGMALANGPNTGGSQFFVCFLPQPQLNGSYVAFGRVLSGMSVFADIVRLEKSATEKKESAGPPPDEIVLAEVISKRNHPYVGKVSAKSSQ